MAQILGTSVDYLTGESNDDGANTALVYKEEEPILYEITTGAKEFNEAQLNRLLKYYKEIVKFQKKKCEVVHLTVKKCILHAELLNTL